MREAVNVGVLLFLASVGVMVGAMFVIALLDRFEDWWHRHGR